MKFHKDCHYTIMPSVNPRCHVCGNTRGKGAPPPPPPPICPKLRGSSRVAQESVGQFEDKSRNVRKEESNKVLRNKTIVLRNKTIVLRNKTIVLRNKTIVLRNKTIVLRNKTIVLCKKTAVLYNTNRQ